MLSINFYYRLRYLINKKSSFKVILSFFLDRLKHPIYKKNKKLSKKMHMEYLKSKNITTDYFSINAYYWKNILKSLPSNFKYLEIGSWEGNSALFILNNFAVKKVVCVDVWKDEKFTKIQEQNFKNFKENIEEFSKQVKICKETSDNFFSKETELYDVIYIDGAHETEQVFKDVKNSWKILNVNGILICDDYFYGNIYNNPNNVPSIAINKFINEASKNKSISIVCVNNSQIFLKKLY